MYRRRLLVLATVSSGAGLAGCLESVTGGADGVLIEETIDSDARFDVELEADTTILLELAVNGDGYATATMQDEGGPSLGALIDTSTFDDEVIEAEVPGTAPWILEATIGGPATLDITLRTDP